MNIPGVRLPLLPLQNLAHAGRFGWSELAQIDSHVDLTEPSLSAAPACLLAWRSWVEPEVLQAVVWYTARGDQRSD